MTYQDFLHRLEGSGLTLQEFAELTRMNRRSLSNYAGVGRVPSHLAIIATLMRELTLRGVDFRASLESIEIAQKKPRGAGTHGRFGGDKQSQFESLIPQ